MKLLSSILMLIIAASSMAQSKTNYGFMNAVIHLRDGDSVVGFVEKQVVYGKTLAYKTSEFGNIKEIPVWQVNYVNAGDKIFTAVPLYKDVLLMERIDSGKAMLYEFSEIKYSATKHDYSTGLKTKKGDIIIHYVLKLPTAIREVKEPGFKEQLKQLFIDCVRMSGKIARGDYLFEDMPQIVKDYNNCKGQYCKHALQPGREH